MNFIDQAAMNDPASLGCVMAFRRFFNILSDVQGRTRVERARELAVVSAEIAERLRVDCVEDHQFLAATWVLGWNQPDKPRNYKELGDLMLEAFPEHQTVQEAFREEFAKRAAQ